MATSPAAMQSTTLAESVRVVADAAAHCETGPHLFVNDGDREFIHYVHTDNELLEVRRIASNPDVESCAIAGDRVFFVDPEYGVLEFSADAEAEPIVRPAYLQPPAGAGALTPVRVTADADRVTVWDAQQRSDFFRVAPPGMQPRQVPARRETAPVASAADAADDPVVVPAANGAFIVGADKTWGIRIYDLDGVERQGLAVGRINNVDAVQWNGSQTLIAGSNRTKKSITLLLGPNDAQMPEYEHVGNIDLTLDDPYGLCMATLNGAATVFVGDKDGRIERWQIATDLSATLIDTLMFDSQTEGCVVDVKTGSLFVGEENVGIWQVNLGTGARSMLLATDGSQLVADVEGLDIYDNGTARYLVASSQGNNSYLLISLQTRAVSDRFRIGPNWQHGIDGASETDGLAVYAKPLPAFPAGILVVQDGHNVLPGENQNFKIVDLSLLGD